MKVISRIIEGPFRIWYALRSLMVLTVRIVDPINGQIYKFIGGSFESFQRGRCLLSKEPETISWLRDNLRSDDVFLDVGANVGVFSIFAGCSISSSGHVYSIEPHLPTASILLQNIAINSLDDRISLLSTALSDEIGFLDFDYRLLRAGASGSQLVTKSNIFDVKKVVHELKQSLSIDYLIDNKIIKAPNLVKIDTDGLELPILKGMTKFLRSKQRPRALTVEIQKGLYQQHIDFFDSVGYKLDKLSFNGKWTKLSKKDIQLEELEMNAFFICKN